MLLYYTTQNFEEIKIYIFIYPDATNICAQNLTKKVHHEARYR